MKSFALLILSVFVIVFVNAQDTISLKHEQKIGKVYPDRPPQAVFVELGGGSILLSANYDRRFSKKTTGLGFRVGLGYSFSNYPSFITIPVGINYLLGKRSNFFEFGLGETLVFLSGRNKEEFGFGDIDANNNTLAITHFTIGYRLQPVRGGFNFRAGLSPLLVKGEAGILPYLSFGYNF